MSAVCRSFSVEEGPANFSQTSLTLPIVSGAFLFGGLEKDLLLTSTIHNACGKPRVGGLSCRCIGNKLCIYLITLLYVHVKLRCKMGWLVEKITL